MTNTEPTTAEMIETLAASLGLSMTAEFVPFSKSRNRAEKLPSLNWMVTLSKGGKAIIATDYMQGSGHCPAYKVPTVGYGLGGKDSADRRRAIKNECETGMQWRPLSKVIHKPIVAPRLADVLHSLVMDSDALDYTFEEWAANCGYDTDSRKAETIYRACLDIAIKLRSAIGDAGLNSLKELCSNY